MTTRAVLSRNIKYLQHQGDEYSEIPVQAALSADDLQRALDVSPDFEVRNMPDPVSIN